MALAETRLTDLTVEVDDETITVEGNTISYQDGLGEASVTAATNGRSPVIISSIDVSTRIGMIKVSVPASIESLNKVKEIKAKGAGRVVRLSGSDPQGNIFGRVMTQGVLTTDPEASIQADGAVEIEFQGAPLVSV